MKTITTIIVILGLAYFLRLNLPPDDIAKNMDLRNDIGFFQEMAAKMAYSQTVANWERMDLIIVKMACSERLKITLIGIPFQKWALFERNTEKCWDFANYSKNHDSQE